LTANFAVKTDADRRSVEMWGRLHFNYAFFPHSAVEIFALLSRGADS